MIILALSLELEAIPETIIKSFLSVPEDETHIPETVIKSFLNFIRMRDELMLFNQIL
jgi:hypothetical protein